MLAHIGALQSFLEANFYCLCLIVHAAPDDPPQQLTSSRSMTTVTFQWLPPKIPNGIIRRYLFTIFTAGKTTSEKVKANQHSMTIENFQPSQLYTVTVIASTLVSGIFADSPPAVLKESTLPDSEF